MGEVDEHHFGRITIQMHAFGNAPPQSPSAPAHPTGKRLTTICASLRSFATAVTDSRQFARRFAPSNCVRWCNSCSLPPQGEGFQWRRSRHWAPNDSTQITCHCLYSRLSSQKRAAHGAERWWWKLIEPPQAGYLDLDLGLDLTIRA